MVSFVALVDYFIGTRDSLACRRRYARIDARHHARG
jgi:hypothetical protein